MDFLLATAAVFTALFLDRTVNSVIQLWSMRKAARWMFGVQRKEWSELAKVEEKQWRKDRGVN